VIARNSTFVYKGQAVPIKQVAEELVKRGLARDCERFSGGRYKELETPSARLLPLPPYCSP